MTMRKVSGAVMFFLLALALSNSRADWVKGKRPQNHKQEGSTETRVCFPARALVPAAPEGSGEDCSFDFENNACSSISDRCAGVVSLDAAPGVCVDAQSGRCSMPVGRTTIVKLAPGAWSCGEFERENQTCECLWYDSGLDRTSVEKANCQND